VIYVPVLNNEGNFRSQAGWGGRKSRGKGLSKEVAMKGQVEIFSQTISGLLAEGENPIREGSGLEAV